MTRVSKRNPCPVCKHPDWCMIGSEDVLCMRSQSARQHTLTDGSIGWWHRISGSDRPVIPCSKHESRPSINIGQILRDWRMPASHSLAALACSLGLSVDCLSRIGCQPAGRIGEFAFPMHDGLHNPIGIRIRNMRGDKWAQPGSRNGLFLGRAYPPGETQLLCEGPTDTAAAIHLGYLAFGRPSCNGGLDFILKHIQVTRARRLVIVTDNDEPGIRGATMLQQQLKIPSVLVLCPSKDIRQFVNRGGTKEMLDNQINSMVWRAAL